MGLRVAIWGQAEFGQLGRRQRLTEFVVLHNETEPRRRKRSKRRVCKEPARETKKMNGALPFCTLVELRFEGKSEFYGRDPTYGADVCAEGGRIRMGLVTQSSD